MARSFAYSLQVSSRSFVGTCKETCEQAFLPFWPGTFGASYQVTHWSSCFIQHPSNFFFFIINRTIIQQHIKHCLERTEERISWLFELEDWPFSLNTHYLSDYKSKFLAHYKGAREKYERNDIMGAIQLYKTSKTRADNFITSSPSQSTGIAKIMAGLAEIGMTGIKPEQLPRLLPADSMQPALVIMAEVRAYFQGNCV